MVARNEPSQGKHRLDYFVPADDAAWHVEQSGDGFSVVVDPDPDTRRPVSWMMWAPSLFFAAVGLIVFVTAAYRGNAGEGAAGLLLVWLLAAFWAWMALGDRRKTQAERQRAQRRLVVTREGVRLVKPHESERWLPRSTIRRIDVRHGRDIPDSLDGGEEGGWIELESEGEPVVFYVPADAQKLAELAQALRARLGES